MENAHYATDYIEFTVSDLAAARRFYTTRFAWPFNYYGHRGGRVLNGSMVARRAVVAAAVCLALSLVLLGRRGPENVAPETVAGVALEAWDPLIATPDDARPPDDHANDAARPHTVATPTTAVASPESQQTPPWPLPGQTPALPMVQLLREAQPDLPPMLAANEPLIAKDERLFAEESVDAEWAPRAEAEILDRFAQQAGLKLIDLQVECRATMCRVQMTQPTAPDEGAWPRQLLGTLGFEPRWIVSLINPWGSLSSVAYLARPGLAPASRSPGEHFPGDQ